MCCHSPGLWVLRTILSLHSASKNRTVPRLLCQLGSLVFRKLASPRKERFALLLFFIPPIVLWLPAVSWNQWNWLLINFPDACDRVDDSLLTGSRKRVRGKFMSRPASVQSEIILVFCKRRITAREYLIFYVDEPLSERSNELLSGPLPLMWTIIVFNEDDSLPKFPAASADNERN